MTRRMRNQIVDNDDIKDKSRLTEYMTCIFFILKNQSLADRVYTRDSLLALHGPGLILLSVA